MRTTVTFKDDVARALERLQRERGSGISELVNDLVRAGLSQAEGEGSKPPFEQETSPMHARMDVTNVGEVLDLLEDEPS